MMWHKNIKGINPMGLFSPWVNYKNKQLFTNMKIKQTTLRFNIKHLQGMNTMGLGVSWIPFVRNLPTQLRNLRTWRTDLKKLNVSMAKGEITKTGTIDTTLHKPVGEANQYVPIGYTPLIIC